MPVPIPGRVGEALRRSTVAVRCSAREAEGTGSGVALHDDLVVTNAHVMRGREVEIESWEGRTVRGRLLRIDRDRDLALLEAKGLQTPPAQLGDSDLVRPGMPVLAVGNPLGFRGAMSSGVVHSNAMGVPGGARSPLTAYRWLCADVRLAPGNSGGPLADFAGQVIGINTMVISGGLALAVPSRSVQAFLKKQARGQMGLTLRPVSAGLLILELKSGGAGEQASLLPGDVIVSANGRGIRFIEDLQLAIEGSETVSLEFVRGGEARLRRVVMRLANQRAATAA